MDVERVMRLMSDEGEPDGDLQTPMSWSVLTMLKLLVPCDGLAFVRLDSNARDNTQRQGLPGGGFDCEDVFFDHYWDCEPCSYPDRSGDLDRIILLSDFYSRPGLHGTGMWAEYLRPCGIEHELVMCLGGQPGCTLRVVFHRAPGLDFGEQERAVAWLLRPHLYQHYRRRRAARAGMPELTARQRELLYLVAQGHTNRQIGRILGITEATARKHLENIFERLRVQSRTAAVAAIFGDR